MPPRRPGTPALPRPGTRPAVQDRSRASRDAILEAFRRLLRTRAFAELSMGEVAREAGVSVGGVYARFAGKEALLVAVVDEAIEAMFVDFDAALSDDALRGATLADVLGAYVRSMLRSFRAHRVLLLQAARGLTGEWAAAMRERAQRVNARAHGRYRELADARRAEIRHPAPARAIELSLFLVSAAAREAVLSDALRAYPVSLDDEALAEEICRAGAAYLGIDAGPTS